VAARPGDDLYAVLGRVSAEEGSIAIVLDEDRIVGVIEPENVADLIRVRMATARNAELARRAVRPLLGA
jgi:hypothetical protein